MSITIRQVIPPNLTDPKVVTNPVTPLLLSGGRLSETPLTTTIREFLFEVTKDGSVFWVGAAVPLGTTDFTRTQIYFHPTVVQDGNIIAADSDYRDFRGGWSGQMQRYVALEGGQLAGARLITLLVPFTTMGALVNPALNMFSVNPVETLNAIMAEIQNRCIPVTGTPNLTQVGVSSFSSGIKALTLFVNTMSSFGLIKEIIDFDGPFNPSHPQRLILSPGAISKCYTQVNLASPEVGWVHLSTASFAGISSYPDPASRPAFHAHACIGFMTYWAAMLTSVIL
jgi:hypothetical protein